jgi:hypothetical protein
MFGDDFFKNSILCFSRFSSDKRTQKARENGSKNSVEKLIQTYTQKFKELYDFNLSKDQFVFINNELNGATKGDYEE